MTRFLMWLYRQAARVCGRFGYALILDSSPIYEGVENGWKLIGWTRAKLQLRRVQPRAPRP